MIENWPLLSILILLPICGSLLALFIPNNNNEDEKNIKTSILNVKLVSLWTSIMTFFLSLLLVLKFDYKNPNYQFLEFSEWIPALGIVYRVGLDGLSLPFIVLTTFLTPIYLPTSQNKTRQIR